ncbi:AMP-binding enzyme [Tigheibacillus jepli]|uniref:AMP-binding enzyme n=1 Tax=Tigheibacillus jepli TaxID=3035914 RepID=UPI00387E1ECD
MENTIRNSVITQIGKIAQPGEIIFVDTLPKTVSGKIMRRLLKEIVTSGTVAGDVTGLEDPTTVEHIKAVVGKQEQV